jgi:hypothetical protein
VRPEIRYFDSADIFDLERDAPADPDSFQFELTIGVGEKGGRGEDLFHLLVCTPDAYAASSHATTATVPILEPGELVLADRAELWPESRHTGFLVVATYDWPLIRAFVTTAVEEIEGDTWHEVAEQIARFAGWEFENYNQPFSLRFPGTANPLPGAFRFLRSRSVPEVHSNDAD